MAVVVVRVARRRSSSSDGGRRRTGRSRPRLPTTPTTRAPTRHLLAPHLRVHSILIRCELVVRAHLGDFPLVQHHDAVGVRDGGKAVGDDEGGGSIPSAPALLISLARARTAADVALQGALGVDVERRGGLVCFVFVFGC